MYDAIGVSVRHLQQSVEKDDVVLVTIITDGLENASQEYSKESVGALLSRQREKGWTFAYIGANQNSVEVARKINIKNALDFEATPMGMYCMVDQYRGATERCYSLLDRKPGSVKDMGDFFVNVDKDGHTEIGGNLSEALEAETLKK